VIVRQIVISSPSLTKLEFIVTGTEAQKDAISLGMKEYYGTHHGPWKGKKRNKKFKDSVSESLKRAYRNGLVPSFKGKTSPFKGRNHSVESIRRMSIARKR
ncbi:MAG: NUMOD3 domain-containing DNA-binding protein, partial [Nitrososphaeraceae archaeon]